ncbi:MAG: SDR family NAD(P)-dependent oxidoreductase, partial [Planctomycetales bacterium]|nr:SDR family NAD(P)-dependent oxidoreductase [Planctomycetales bacterium]
MNVLDLFRLNGRTALITGGSRGLGRVFAEAFAQAGASTVIMSRDAEACQLAAMQIAALPVGAPPPSPVMSTTPTKSKTPSIRRPNSE